MIRRAPLAVLGLALCGWFALAAGCTDAPGASQLQAQASAGDSFWRGDPRLSVAHSGIRRVEFPGVAGPGRSFRERVTTDGHGRYSIEPLETLEAASAEWDSFELTQRAREGFVFRYRDFLVRDPRLFARNWRTTDLARTVVVAGRTCALHRVERTGGPGRVFELSIDVQTSLLLASQELDADGRLIAALIYESVELDPDLAAVAWHVPANEERAFDPGTDDAAQEIVGPVLQPRLLPRGYGPLESATVGGGAGVRWLKRTYTDGVEPLFLFQALAGPAEGGAPGAAAPLEAGLEPSVTPSSVIVFEIGAARAIQGKVDGFELMVIGKAPQAELLDLIESSLP